MNPRTWAVLGGLRSGKSARALERFRAEFASRGLGRPVYLATLLPPGPGDDPDLELRILRHRQERPASWPLVEVGRDLAAAGRACREAGHDAWLLDGLGAWAALVLDSGREAAQGQWEAFAQASRGAGLVGVVLDEVGLGGVPAHPAARAFADLNGELNQWVCAWAEAAWELRAGLEVRLK